MSLSLRRKIHTWKKVASGISSCYPKFHMPSRHAEIDAINKIIKWKNKPSQVDILVIRISTDGKLINSKPCLHCIKYLKRKNNQLKINKIYYSNDNKIVCESLFEIDTEYITRGMKELMSNE